LGARFSSEGELAARMDDLVERHFPWEGGRPRMWEPVRYPSASRIEGSVAQGVDFLDRTDELLEELLEDLRQQAKGQTRQHWLLRGPRGIGKTHLAGVIYHRV